MNLNYYFLKIRIKDNTKRELLVDILLVEIETTALLNLQQHHLLNFFFSVPIVMLVTKVAHFFTLTPFDHNRIISILFKVVL